MSAENWNGVSVAHTLEGNAGPSNRGEFAAARDGTPTQTEAAELQQSSESSSGALILAPPDPNRFAEIQLQAGRKSLAHALEVSR